MSQPTQTELERTQELHNCAMDQAEEAVLFRMRHDTVNFERATKSALEMERKAAETVAPYFDYEPTRAILHRSAASLALDLHDWKTAERLICTALAGYPPNEIAEELRDMLEIAHFERHFHLRGMELADTDARLVMAGPAVSYGFIEYREFRQRTDAAEKMFLRTAERQLKIAYREDSYIPANFQRHFGTYMGVQEAASYAVAVRIGTGQLTLPDMTEVAISPDKVIDEVMECIRLANTNEEFLKERIADDAYYRNFMGLHNSLSPDGDRISTVGFTIIRNGKEVNIPVKRTSLKESKSLRNNSGNLLKMINGGKSQEKQEEIAPLTGILQAADKVASHFVRVKSDDGKVTKVSVPEGMMSDIVKPLWDERVVMYVKPGKKRNSLELISVERYIENTST